MDTNASRATPKSPGLAHNKGLIISIANEHRLTFGCAQAICTQDSTLSTPCLSEKELPCAPPLATQLAAQMVASLDAQQAGQLEAICGEVNRIRGQLDFVFHAARINTAYSCVWAWVISTHEDLLLALHKQALLAPGNGEWC